MRKFIALLCVGVLCLGLIAGCGPAKPETTQQQPAANVNEPETEGFKGKLAWYAPAPHPYFEEVKIGVEQFIADMGIDVIMQVGPDWTQASENEKVESLVAQGVTGISIYPCDATGANGLYEEIGALGVHVVNFGTDTARPNTSEFAVATDVYEAAYDACEKLIELMGGSGNILNVLEVLEDPNTALRKEAIEACAAAHPGVSIIQEIAGIQTSDEAVSKIESAMSANVGNIDGIIGTGFMTTVGIAQNLADYYEKQGTDKHIAAIGIDTDPIVLKAIEDGILDGTIAQNPVGQGYLSMMLLKLMDEGYTPASPDNYFVAGGHLFVGKHNLTTYEAEIGKVTEQLSAELTTKYLKKG